MAAMNVVMTQGALKFMKWARIGNGFTDLYNYLNRRSIHVLNIDGEN